MEPGHLASTTKASATPPRISRDEGEGTGMNMTGEKSNDFARRPDMDAGIDPRWHALATGTLSEAEAAALREEAKASEEGRALRELYEPLGEDVKERIFEAVYARVRPPPQAKPRRSIADLWRDLPGALRMPAPLIAGFTAVAAVVLFIQLAGRPPEVEVDWSNQRGRWDAPVLDTPD